jgi:hypothetical protein
LEAKKIKQRMTALPSAAVGKATFAEGFAQVLSAHLGKLTPSRVFPAVPSVLAQGTRHSWEHPIRVFQGCRELGRRQRDGLGKAVGATCFFKKTNLKLYADGLESDRRQRGFENPSVRNGYFFPPTARRGLSAETLPRVWTLGSRQRFLAEKKFSGSTVPSGAVGKAFADGFGHSAKDLFPVVSLDTISRYFKVQ